MPSNLKPLRNDVINLGRWDGFTSATVPHVYPKRRDSAAVFQHWGNDLKPVLTLAAQLINRLPPK